MKKLRGHGIIVEIEGKRVAVGNNKLMNSEKGKL